MTFTFKLERLDGTPADPPSFKKDRAWQNGELDEAERTSRGPSSEKSSSALSGRTRTTRSSAWARYAGRGSWCRAGFGGGAASDVRPELRPRCATQKLPEPGDTIPISPGSKLQVVRVKGVKTRPYSGCGSVVLVEATAKAIAALDITAG
jgi:hypothetical protein